MNFQNRIYISTGNNKNTHKLMEKFTPKTNRKFIAILFRNFFFLSSHEIEKKKNASEKNIFHFPMIRKAVRE